MPVKYNDDITGDEIDPNALKPFELEVRIVFGQEEPLYFRKEYICNGTTYNQIKGLVAAARAQFQADLDSFISQINAL